MLRKKYLGGKVEYLSTEMRHMFHLGNLWAKNEEVGGCTSLNLSGYLGQKACSSLLAKPIPVFIQASMVF